MTTPHTARPLNGRAVLRGRDVVAALVAGCEGVLELRALPSTHRTHVALDDAAAVAAFATAHADENVYLGVATRRDDSGGALAHCQHLGALFADLDCKDRSLDQARRVLEHFPIAPSIVIGSGGGLHVYWLLREPLDVQADPAAVTALLRRLAAAVDGDLAAAEPARILRLPGTRNHKYDPPRPVTVELCDPDRRYNPSDFDDYLPAAAPTMSPTATPLTLEAEIGAGQRNDVLYRLVRSLRKKALPDGAILDAVRAVNVARCRPPLESAEVDALVTHALTQPDRPGHGATGTRTMRPASPAAATTATWRWLGDVEREYVAWLWRTRLAFGTLTLWIGDGGLGKSRASNDVAARITTGACWPDGEAAEAGTVVILSAEDSASYTIRPAIEAAGGDVSKVAILDAVRDAEGQERTFQLGTDLAALEELLDATRASLVIIDPLSAYFGTTLDSYRDTDVRAVLEPIVKLAERRRVAVLGIMHIGKGTDRSARHRALGSVAFVNAARLVFAVGADPDDATRRLLVPVKANLCREAAPLAFRLEDADGVARVVWETGPVADVSADTVLNGRPVVTDADSHDAAGVIADLLDSEDWPLHAADALKAGEAHGIPSRTMRRTARQLGIAITKVGFRGVWQWHRPEGASGQAEPVAAPVDVATDSEAATLNTKGHEAASVSSVPPSLFLAPSASTKGPMAPSAPSQYIEQNTQRSEGAKRESTRAREATAYPGCSDPDCTWRDGPDREARASPLDPWVSVPRPPGSDEAAAAVAARLAAPKTGRRR